MLDPDKVPPTGATMVLTHTGTRDKDRFYFYWKGSVSGGSLSDHIDLIPATAGKPVRVTVPKQYVTANRNGTVVADYRIERGGETLGHSRELKLRIGVALDLKDPEIKEAPNNILQPIAAKDTLTAVVRAYPDMIGTQVSVTWTGTPGEGSKTEGPVNVTMQQDMEIPLPNSLVAFNLGKTVKVIYTVIRNGVPQDSDELILTVLPIADGDKNLPTPSIDGAVGDELDVTRLEEGAQLRIEKWMLQAVGQCIWLSYNGTDKNGNPVVEVFRAGEAHQQAEGLVTAAQVAWLRELKDETELKISFKLNYDKLSNASNAVSFPESKLTIRNSQVGGFENWDDEPARKLPLNVVTKFKSGLEITPIIEHIQGTFIHTRFTSPPVMGLGIYKMCRTRFKLAEDSVTNITITLDTVKSSSYKIRFYDREILIEELNLPYTVAYEPFNYEAPTGRRFNFFEIWTEDVVSAIPIIYIGDLKWFNYPNNGEVNEARPQHLNL